MENNGEKFIKWLHRKRAESEMERKKTRITEKDWLNRIHDEACKILGLKIQELTRKKSMPEKRHYD